MQAIQLFTVSLIHEDTILDSPMMLLSQADDSAMRHAAKYSANIQRGASFEDGKPRYRYYAMQGNQKVLVAIVESVA